MNQCLQRTAKQLKKAWDNHKTKIKRMQLISQYSDNNIDESVSKDRERGSPAETRVESNALRGPDPELIQTENDLGEVTRNIVLSKATAESSAKPGTHFAFDK